MFDNAKYQRAWTKRNRNKTRLYGRRYRAKNWRTYKAWNDIRTTSIIEFCKFLREVHPCADCGRYDLYYTMEFDHVGEPRVCSPSAGGDWTRVYRELAKCEIVCARCHRIRTHARKTGIL